MSAFRELTGSARRLLASPEQELTRWQKAARDAMRLVRICALELKHDRAPQMAAALAYRTLFGLIPTLVLGLVVLRFFYGADALVEPLNRFMEFLGLRDLAITSEAGPDQGGEQVGDWVRQLVQRVSELNFAAIGAVGVIVLVYAAVSLIVQIEQAFNRVYDAPAARRLLTRITSYWTILTLGPLGLVASFYVGERFKSAVESLGGSAVIGLAGVVVTFTIAWLLLLLAYMVVPNTRVGLKPALIGSFTAALLWELGKAGFTWYLGFSTGYATFYGSLGLLPIFMLWVYLTWLIVLFGLEVAYAVQTLRRGEGEIGASRAEQRTALDPAAAVALLAVAVERFRAGASLSLAEAADLTGMPQQAAARLFERLVRAGLMRRTEEEQSQTGFTLARPPESIAVGDALAAAEPLQAEPHDPGARAALTRLRRVQMDAVGGRSLATLIEAGEPGQ